MNILGTTKISYEIEQILNYAEEYLVLVTPYLKLNKRLKIRLSDAFNNVENVFILYRKNKVETSVVKWLQSFKNINLYPIENLHSKIYLSEKIAIITSMNLYEYSQINNHEIGVLIDNTKDNFENYNSILDEIRIILQNDRKFLEKIDIKKDYSMRKLFRDLSENYKFKNHNSGSSFLYQFLSDKSMEIMKFEDFELYQDKTAVLRSTELGKKRFLKLKRELKKFRNK